MLKAPFWVVLQVLLLFCSGCGATRWLPFVSQKKPAFTQPEPSSHSPNLVPLPGNGQRPEEAELQPPYETEADLLQIVSHFQKSAHWDTYRFPIPKDPTGANVFKATLTRLKDYEDQHPGAYPELIAFTRARAYERLHEYERALEAYRQVAQGKGRLRAEALRSIEILERFHKLKSEAPSASTPLDYLKALDQKIAAWQELGKELAGTPYAPLAREEEERLDWAKVAFLELNRYQFENGNALVILAYRQLIRKHRDSKNIYRYQIELGDFYFTLAQEYAAKNNPEGLHFDRAVFEQLGRSALRLYGQVAQEDGIMEKLEAKGKLAALEAYMAKVGKLNQ